MADSTWTDVPDASEGRRGRPVVKRKVERNGVTRRTALRTAVGGATAVGLFLLDSASRYVPASAAGAYTEWFTCRGFFNANTICVPSNSYFGADNCGNNGWHKNAYENFGSCEVRDYTHLSSTCDGNNAWRWTTGGARRKCSDGLKDARNYCTGDTINEFSICRTAI